MKTKWNLDQNFGYNIEDTDRIRTEFSKYEKKVFDFAEKWNKGVDFVLGHFGEWLSDCDTLSEEITSMMVYLSLKSSLDVNNQKIQKIQAELSKRATDLSEKTLFVETIYKEIGYDRLVQLSRIYIGFSNSLLNRANSIKYSLSEPEERVCLKLNEALSDDLYDEYIASIMLEYKGEKKTFEEVLGYRMDSDRANRILAYQTISNFFNTESNNVIFGNLYSSICRSDIADMELRKIEGVMTPRNLNEEMDNVIVDQLIYIVTKNYGLYQAYLKKKAVFMGLTDFSVFDILAPLGAVEAKLDFETGANLYLNTIRKVDESIYEHGLKMLDGYTDVYIAKGKRGGAFCSYDKSTSPHVLLNWQDKLDDVNTLAHEFGHAFHGLLAADQNHSNYNSPLVLAETASIFNETIMFNAVLDETEVKNQKIMIFNRLDDLFSTIFRQIMYIRFEKRCHESWKENKPLTFDDYNAMWLEESKLLYGSAINWTEETEGMAKYGWKSIPHIYHTPFYCYAYSFGNLLSLNVYAEYEKAADKQEFMKKYFSLLKSGGSQRPKDVLKKIFNFDISSDSFYQIGMDYITGLVDKL